MNKATQKAIEALQQLLAEFDNDNLGGSCAAQNIKEMITSLTLLQCNIAMQEGEKLAGVRN